MELDTLAFLKEVSRSFSQIGSVVPSSAALGRAMTRPIREGKSPLRILEVGPGTGPVTRQILRSMGPLDSLLVCEINSRFLERLQIRLDRNRHYNLHRDRVSFFNGPVQALHQPENFRSFDVIISTLPFSNFTPSVVDGIFKTYHDLLKEGGQLTFCEYIGVRKWGSLIKTPEDRQRVKDVDAVVRQWCVNADQRGELKKEVTILNVPPAFTVQFRL